VAVLPRHPVNRQQEICALKNGAMLLAIHPARIVCTATAACQDSLWLSAEMISKLRPEERFV
jgi:hypothetical protein